MSTVSKLHPVTIEQYRGFRSPPGFRDELIRGEIVVSPDPKFQHQEVAYRIHRWLERVLVGAPFVARQRINMRLESSHSMPSPDVFVMDRERWFQTEEYPVGSPQVVVEVISPSNRHKKTEQKAGLYLENGAWAVWLVDPKQRQIKVLEPGVERMLSAEDDIQLPRPLPDDKLLVGRFFDFTAEL